MPVYGSAQAGGIASIGPGDTYTLFSAEVLTAPVASVSLARAIGTDATAARPLTFTFDFASSPTASIQVQGSNRDIAADYVDLGAAVTTQHGFATITDNFAFYRVNLASQSGGGALTAIVHG